VRWFFAVRWLRSLLCVYSLPCARMPLCRALLVAVRSMAALPCAFSLPCIILLSHGKEIFVVWRRTKEFSCMATIVFPVVHLWVLSTMKLPERLEWNRYTITCYSNKKELERLYAIVKRVDNYPQKKESR
jgi:hypothetical protein